MTDCLAYFRSYGHAAIKRFFEVEPNGRKITVAELKDVGKEDRQELGRLACEERSSRRPER